MVKLLTILYLIILHKWKPTQSQKSHEYKMNYKFGQKWIFPQKSASLGDLKHRAHEGMFKFPILFKFKEKLRVLLKKNIFDGKEMSKNINGTRSETQFASVKDSLNMYWWLQQWRQVKKEKEKCYHAQGQGKKSFHFMWYNLWRAGISSSSLYQ